MRFIVCALLLFLNTSLSATVKVGEIPPQIVGITLGGEQVNLANYRGKVVILTYWATWCPYCLKEMPILANIQQKLKDYPFQIIAVNFKEDRKIFRDVARKTKKYGMVMAWDRKGKYGDAYEVTGLPFLVIINKDGTIASKYRGYGEKTLGKIINRLNELLTPG